MLIRLLFALLPLLLAMPASAQEEPVKAVFTSKLTGEDDHFAYLRPRKECESVDLVVYFHGLGKDYLEPFQSDEQHASLAQSVTSLRDDIAFLSVNCGGAESWGTPDALADATANIRELCNMFTVKRIVLMGSSMGGTIALNYSALAPHDIRRLVTGVVAADAAGQMRTFHELCPQQSIKASLEKAFGGTPLERRSTYDTHGVAANLKLVSPSLRCFLIFDERNRFVPPSLQDWLTKALSARGCAVQVTETPTDGGLSKVITAFREGLQFALAREPEPARAAASVIPGWE